MQNHYFNEHGYYSYSGYANPDNFPPLNATREAPEQREGFYPKWNGEAWDYVEDMRGTKYYMPDGSEHEITAVEGQIPEGARFAKPESPEGQSASTKGSTKLSFLKKCQWLKKPKN
ncbi:hypothetical protein [Halodesulfovibrio aestuarii]|uniref:Uncharacterized protein n=1 Tax=Halodesulfovibrio aestuarii TaxID=126333 RepID=A0ABV4JPV5_9BACT